MGIYIFILFFIIFSSIIYEFLIRKYDKKNVLKVLFFIDSAILIIFQCIRGFDIGTDVKNYLKFFDSAQIYGLRFIDGHRFELGFKMFTYYFTKISTNKSLYLSVISIFSLGPLCYMIYKNSKQPFFSLMLYICLNFYAFTFSGLRQSIALAFVYISYFCIKNRNLKLFTLLIIIAGLFHKTAFVFLPAYFLYKIKLNKKVVISLVALDILVFVFKEKIFNLLIINFYDSYELVETSAYMWTIFCILVLIFCSLFYKKTVKNNVDANGLYIFLWTNVTILLFTTVGTNVLRIANYYCSFIVLLIPEVIYMIDNAKLRILFKYGFIIVTIILFFYFLIGDGYSIVPYKSIWSSYL